MTLHGFADLHLHTTASDGTQSIDRLVERAKAMALSCLAITDHDVISSQLTRRVTTMHDLEVITGVELKADFDGVAGELLGYFVDPGAPRLRALLAFMERARVVRMEKMVQRCREQGIDIQMEEVRALAQGNIGRPHIARVLMNKGAIGAMEDAFRGYIGKGQPCYVPLEKVGFREAVTILHEAGGVVSVAHPCLMRVEGWDRFLSELRAAGVDGMESVYPYRDPESPELTIPPHVLEAKAADHGFLTTGGSDDHGEDSTKVSLGTVRLPYAVVRALKQVAGLVSS